MSRINPYQAPNAPPAGPRPAGPRPGRGLRWMAVGVAAATLPLVFVGGLVTSFKVGLAVPDWPTTFAENMFLYNWFHSPSFGVFLEHGHRLLAAGVGLLTIALAAWLHAAEPRAWVRRLGWVAVAAVVFQGVLGGLRVIWRDSNMAAVHGAVAQAFFALMACIALVSSRSWTEAGPPRPAAGAARLRLLALAASAMIYAQLVAGSILRHRGVGLHLHMALAALVVLAAGLVVGRVFLDHADQPALVRAATALMVLITLQVMLGIAAWATANGYGDQMTTPPGLDHILITTAHVAAGALTFVAAVFLTLRAYQSLRPLAEPAGPPALVRRERIA